MTWPIAEVKYGNFYHYAREVSGYLEYGHNFVAIDHDKESLIRSIIERGLAQFFSPPILPPESQHRPSKPHRWSFLRPVAQLTLGANESLAPLPDDCTGVVGDFTYVNNAGTFRVPTVPLEHLRQVQANIEISGLDPILLDDDHKLLVDDSAIPTGMPIAAAIETKAVDGGPFAFQVRFYPTPSQAVTLEYSYEISPLPLSELNLFPAAPRVHYDTILASCLAAAEVEKLGQSGPRWSYFIERLKASVAADIAAAQTSADSLWTYGETSKTADVTYREIQRRVGAYLGYGWSPLAWTHAQIQQVDEIIRHGVNEYYTPQISGNSVHEWSFMRPVGSITTASGQREYPLPENFERLMGQPTYADRIGQGYDPLEVTTEQRLRAFQAVDETSSYPRFAAVKALGSGGSDRQSLAMVLHPTPDAAYEIAFQYQATSVRLSTENRYPLGGPVHGEGVLLSCMAAAELHRDNKEGGWAKKFQSRLQTNIATDQRRAAQNFGYNGNCPRDGVYGRVDAFPYVHRTDTTYLGQTWD